MAWSEVLRINPSVLKFPFELNKQIACSIQFTNTSNDYVAFKIKTTSPKKYCVQPNTGTISPNSSRDVIVTMQAQQDAPSDMQCKDKFLVQSVVVPSGVFSQDVFGKESGNQVFETKLRVSYVQPTLLPSSIPEVAEEEFTSRSLQPFSGSNFSSYERVLDKVGGLKAELGQVRQSILKLAEEKKAALKRGQQLQQEIETMVHERGGSDITVNVQSGFSFLLVLFVGILGIILGHLFHLR